jgi:DNA polymerase-3 subunit alpha
MKTISKIVTHYSLCKSIVRSEKLIPKAKELGINTLILSDINYLTGSVDMMKECDKAGIKWIIGVTLDLIPDGRISTFGGTITLLAKNMKGWKCLLKIIGAANNEKNFKDKPQIKLQDINDLNDGESLIAVLGGYNSSLAHQMVDHEARFCDNYDAVKALSRPNWIEACKEEIGEVKGIFGMHNVYLEVQKQSLQINWLLNAGNRYLGKQLGIKCIPSNPVHYIEQDDWVDHHLVLCIGQKIKKSQLRELKDVENYPFICGPNFSLNVSDSEYTSDEIKNLEDLASRCETYKVFSNPRLPKFPTPDNKTEPEYLRDLCKEGWKKKIEGKIPKEKIKEYADRVKEELDITKQVDDIINEPLLSRYWLISQDYANYAKSNDIMMGPGRGSSGGSMIANLLNITEIDPIKYGLFFSRFFNTGRINKDKFSLPDIDMDFEINKREQVIEYIRNKYGRDRVGQVITLGRLQGRGAMKEILRINESCTMDEMNKITSYIPDEAKIADDLQEMKDTGEEVSIILWALKHNREKLAKWCWIDDQGNFQGEYARLFEQAVRLEGTFKVMGKHAAAVVISAEPLAEVCPVIHNKNGSDPLAGLEFSELEPMGILKADILGVATLDKSNETEKLIKERSCQKI